MTVVWGGVELEYLGQPMTWADLEAEWPWDTCRPSSCVHSNHNRASVLAATVNRRARERDQVRETIGAH